MSDSLHAYRNPFPEIIDVNCVCGNFFDRDSGSEECLPSTVAPNLVRADIFDPNDLLARSWVLAQA